MRLKDSHPPLAFRTSRLVLTCVAIGCCQSLFAPQLIAEEDLSPTPTPAAAAARIDQQLAEFWQPRHIQPAPQADDAVLLRRATLDLAGRVPAIAEQDSYQQAANEDRYAELVQRLLKSPEFAIYMSHVLDEIIQGSYSGDERYVAFLRQRLSDGESWDGIFQQTLLGPWKEDDQKQSMHFLTKRIKDHDRMMSDVTRVFFGVDITCAKCHDHPLVADWSQDHYYGMLAFFNRTTGNKTSVSEKKDGEVTFLEHGGSEKTAPMMFLTGQIIDEPSADEKKKLGEPFSRRAELVRVALSENDRFFRRAITNRVWEYFFGRGLVHPTDQMHSGNEASVPGVLEELSLGFAASGYDIRWLVKAIVSSGAYQRSSYYNSAAIPDADTFAVFGLRPLNRRQYAVSLVQVLAHPTALNDGENAAKSHEEIEKQAAGLLAGLDQRSTRYQASAAEALFISNSKLVQDLASAEGGLVEKLLELQDRSAQLELAFRTILTRSPTDQEIEVVSSLLDGPMAEPRVVWASVAWSLATGAEFRFNH